MKVEVDRDLCMGSGQCSFHAPLTFEIDADATVALTGVLDAPERVAMAAEACPMSAIMVIAED